MRLDANLIRHCPGRHVERCLLAEQRRDALLQAIHRWIFAEDIVADLGSLYRGPHAGRGLGHGVTAEIDGWFGHRLSSVSSPLQGSVFAGSAFWRFSRYQRR